MVTRQPRRPSAAAEPQPLRPIPTDARPYRGLEAFREEDAHLFFGRDALAQKVLDKLDHHRLVLLMGASGSGKSSLINAGILAKLRQEQGRTIVRCIPGDRAIANLAAALALALEPDRSPADLLPAQQAYKAQLEANPDAIRDIAQLLPKGLLLLVIDQFEETFTLTRPANPKQHDALIATLLAIARSPDERKLEALLGMRSDFMNELETADPHLVQALDNASVQMHAMLPHELEAAITGPLQPYGVTLEPGLLPAIAADLKGNPDALPLLEVALEELWQQRDEPNRRLTKAAYAEIGGITGALARRADHALEQLGLDETAIRRLFLELVRVDPDGTATKSTRRPRTKTELDALDPDLWPLGQKLATPKIRLLVTRHDETSGEETLDITHESLFRQWQRLAGWIEEERDFLIFRQRVDQRMAEFTASGKNPDYLLSKSDVQKAQALESEGKTFSADQQAYIARSAIRLAEDAADDTARALWGRLELSFDWFVPMPEHDRLALTTLAESESDVCRRVLLLAVTDRDAARKFNRRAELVLRAALGLAPLRAFDLSDVGLRKFAMPGYVETEMAWLALARHLMPISTVSPADIAEGALSLATETTYPLHLQALAQTIAAVADKLDLEKIKQIVGRIFDFAGTKNSATVFALVPTISAVSHLLDEAAANEIVLRTLDLIEIQVNAELLRPLLQSIATLACKIDATTITQFVGRAVELVEKTTDVFQIRLLAQIISVLLWQLDGTMVLPPAERTVARALDLADDTNVSFRLQLLAQAVTDLAGLLDTLAADRAVNRALDLLSKSSDPSAPSLRCVESDLEKRCDSSAL